MENTSPLDPDSLVREVITLLYAPNFSLPTRTVVEMVQTMYDPKKRTDITSLVISLSINRPVTIGRSLTAWFVFLLRNMVTRLRSTPLQLLHHTRKRGVRYPLQALRVSFLFRLKIAHWIYPFLS